MPASFWRRAADGAIAGAVATLPMTAFMIPFFRQLPWWQRFEAPPQQVAMETLEIAGVRPALEQHHEAAFTTATHFAYGATVGAVYAGLVDDGCSAYADDGNTGGRRQATAAVRGSAFGLGVWAASYLGWLTADEFRASADRQTRERNAMMIGAHVVFGASLGLAYEHLRRRRSAQHHRQREKAAVHSAKPGSRRPLPTGSAR